MTNLYFEGLEIGTRSAAGPYTDGYRIAPLLPGKGQDYLGRREIRLGFDLNQTGYAFHSQDAPQRKQAACYLKACRTSG